MYGCIVAVSVAITQYSGNLATFLDSACPYKRTEGVVYKILKWLRDSLLAYTSEFDLHR